MKGKKTIQERSIKPVNDNDFISKALFHVKHAQLRWTMPKNNSNKTHTHARTHSVFPMKKSQQ